MSKLRNLFAKFAEINSGIASRALRCPERSEPRSWCCGCTPGPGGADDL